MRDYTKTGKKVKCININRNDLTYKKVYDVFIDDDGDKFVIDESGDWRYDSMEFPYWIEIFDDVAEATNTVSTANETKPKFKVGDTVRVVDIRYIYQATSDIKVGDVGVITYVDSDYVMSPYRVEFDDDDYWWFTDKCIELVNDDVNITNETKPKFKEGDKVMVVNTDYISAYDAGVRVGDIGTVIEGGVDKYHVKFDGTGYDCDWWFTDKCIELVNDDTIENNPTENTPIKSDGGSSSYYAQQIPKGMLERFNTTGTIEAKDVIRLFLGNDFNMGNIFKAYCRIISLRNGKGKAGIDEQYDLTKAKYFTEDELNYYLENTNV